MKKFYIEGCCVPEKHYMVDIRERLAKIKSMVDDGLYFTINRGRQYGKTTTIRQLEKCLSSDYIVIQLDFQKLGAASFSDESTFACSFADMFLRKTKNKRNAVKGFDDSLLADLEVAIQSKTKFVLKNLFEYLSKLCDTAEKPVILIIDEVDSATNNQVFLDFLAQLRGYYLEREETAAFQSVILAGVYDIKNLKLKYRPGSEPNKYNSPWNIAAEFDVRMNFTAKDIAGMLRSYEADHHTGMDVDAISKIIYDYTSGYPFLVSYICKMLDEKIPEMEKFENISCVWTEEGIAEAVKVMVRSKIVLFDSMMKQCSQFPELKEMLRNVIFMGRQIPYSQYDEAIEIGTMFGFLKEDGGKVAIANRIFELVLLDKFTADASKTSDSYSKCLKRWRSVISC